MAGQSGIVWTAKVEQDWVLDQYSLESEADSGIATLKLYHDPAARCPYTSPFLADLVCAAAASGQLNIYRDAACTIPTDWLQVLGYPVAWTDSVTGEEKMLIGCLDFDPMAIDAWRVRQTLICRPKSDAWSAHVDAVAPLVIEKNKSGDSIGMKPLFWFKPDDRRPDLNSDRICWAKRSVSLQHKTLIPLTAFQIPVERDSTPALLAHFRRVINQRPDIALYDAENKSELQPEQRQDWLIHTDTIMHCFNDDYTAPEIIHSDMLAHADHLFLAQTWYWDAHRKGLSICLDAVGPLLDIRDDVGNFLRREPAFYRRVRKQSTKK